MPAPTAARPLANTEIARQLATYANTLQTAGENPFKVRAYRSAAQTIKSLRESIAQQVQNGADVTRYPGIGKGIAAALREIVFQGTLGQLELQLQAATPELAAITEYPALDPKRTARIFKKFKLRSVADLKVKLEDGSIADAFGHSMADHVRNALRESMDLLLDDADLLAEEIRMFLLHRCGATRAELGGDVRRRVETVQEIVFVVESDDFGQTLKHLATFHGGIDLVGATDHDASFQLPGSVPLIIRRATPANWGTVHITATGSKAHLADLKQVGALSRKAKTEIDAYTSMGLAWIPPELREGRGEVAQAARDALPHLVELADIRGDLHLHTTASDGMDTIEAMAEAARALGYTYLGITDHSQSLRIARGVSVANLRTQIRRIDKLNEKLSGIRLLKSAEVDILADGALDYPDDLLAELDYTICSIHSRFRMGRQEQTERILRAMDHPAFSILGHATGRIILRRTGYEIDLPRIIAHAKANRCYFEINADPDRLDLSSDNVREVAKAGIKLAIGSDAHRATGLGYMHCGVDVARRAALEKSAILNTYPLPQLLRHLRRE